MKEYKGVPTLEVEEVYLDEQELDEKDKALLDTIYSRLDIFQSKNSPIHDKAIECRQILHMDDPQQDSEETIKTNGKRTLQLQTLKSTINNVVADQQLSMPEAKLLPETENDQETADELQDLVHHVVYVANDFEHVHYRRCEDFYGTGTSIVQVAWDPDMEYGKGDVALIRWPLEAFLWDPTAEYIQDCRAVMKVSWHPKSWYEEHYPDKARFITSDDGEHKNVGKTEGQTDAEHQDDEKRALLIEYWWRTYDAKTRRYAIHVAYAAGNALLEVHENIYAHGLFPFIIDVHDTIEGCLAGEGLVSQLVPMMRYINRYAAYADMNARRSSKGRLLVRKSAGIDKEALTNWENDVIEGDSIQMDSIMWMQNQPFNGTITQLMTMMQSDLKADSGANQFTRGETTGGIVSGKAINSLIQAGSKIASMRTEQLKYGFKQMVEQILWLMAQYYDDDRRVRIVGKNKTITVDKEKMFGKKMKGAIPPPPYTVQIEVSSRDPQRIADQNQMFMEAFTMAAQTENPMRLSDLFEILNLDGKDRILPVIQKNEKYNEAMRQLQSTVEELEARVAAMQEENVTLRKEATASNNTLAKVASQRGSNALAEKIPSANNPDTANAVVNASRNTLGMPTGQELPT